MKDNNISSTDFESDCWFEMSLKSLLKSASCDGLIESAVAPSVFEIAPSVSEELYKDEDIHTAHYIQTVYDYVQVLAWFCPCSSC